jgi:hypothetical protein
MTVFQIILVNILVSLYGASIIGCFAGYAINIRYSETADYLGHDRYMFTALIVSLVPVLNTFLTITAIHEMWVNHKAPKEHDLVISCKNIGTVPQGTIGTIVHIYPFQPKNEQMYEVEFILEDGKVVVKTVSKFQIIQP